MTKVKHASFRFAGKDHRVTHIPLTELESMDILDRETLAVLKSLERPQDPVSFLGDLIDTFIEETPEVLEALAHALENSNVKAAHYHAHQLKGLASNIGIIRLSALAESIEISLEENKLPDVAVVRPLLELYRRQAIEDLLNDWKK